MTDYQVGVVGHLQRADRVHQLMDTAQAVFASVDDGTLGCNGNHRRVLEKLSGYHTNYSVVLEDDAILCGGWTQQVEQALRLTPESIVSFYLGTSYPKQWQGRASGAVAQAHNSNAAWIVSSHLLHAVGYAIPTKLVSDFLGYDSKAPIDQAITEWARASGHKVAYPMPSIIDHLDGATLADHPDGIHRNLARVAHRFGIPHWNSRTVRL